jgi:predicted kinase
MLTSRARPRTPTTEAVYLRWLTRHVVVSQTPGLPPISASRVEARSQAQSQARSRLPVTVIAGPPCSGKSTLARHLAQHGDIVLDFDDICREVGGSHQWAHSSNTKTAAELLMRQRVSQLPTFNGQAYVIRTAPRPAQRVSLAQHLSATVWVLDPGITVCLQRALSRPRGTSRVIRRWYALYQPAPCDSAPPSMGWAGNG